MLGIHLVCTIPTPLIDRPLQSYLAFNALKCLVPEMVFFFLPAIIRQSFPPQSPSSQSYCPWTASRILLPTGHYGLLSRL
jgi:hypothetical protein